MTDGSSTFMEKDPTIVPGVSPQLYCRNDFERIARLVHDEAGIVLNERKAMLAYSRIAPLVRESAANRFADFLDTLDHNPAQKTRTVAALTTNHTYFNQNPTTTNISRRRCAPLSSLRPRRVGRFGCGPPGAQAARKFGH